ncbi:MFS transporter [Roseiarcaceae bacterium H3SJ34-1]|uniref:MFS transporter n=1 Tax=Terripilifer ovatus TaxID=3032367 RepID=UPI003AB99F87|nr:MFS transporter [Roseiarcaceae bacterium H3SJ34-1]
MDRDKLQITLLNAGHFLDHLVMLVFATVSAIALTREWNMGYSELLAYATPSFVAFALFSWPAGWIADRWSREGMMAVYFIGLGLASIGAGFASSPLGIATGLFFLGMFAAIYHPVGLALLVQGRPRTGMLIAVNGVWGNLGVGSAALFAGYFIDHGGWRYAFLVPGLVSITLGVAYAGLMRQEIASRNFAAKPKAGATSTTTHATPEVRAVLIRLSMVIFSTALFSSLIFQSTTFALPKIFDERLQSIVGSATTLGWLTFLVFAIASMAQLLTGLALDRYSPRTVYIVSALAQTVFFALMPGLMGWPALVVGLGFTFAAFGSVPINDFLIGRMAKSELRAQIYGARYVLSFSVMSLALPLIAWVHLNWGFDRLFQILAVCAGAILISVTLLPRRLPEENIKPALAGA